MSLWMSCSENGKQLGGTSAAANMCCPTCGRKFPMSSSVHPGELYWQSCARDSRTVAQGQVANLNRHWGLLLYKATSRVRSIRSRMQGPCGKPKYIFLHGDCEILCRLDLSRKSSG